MHTHWIYADTFNAYRGVIDPATGTVSYQHRFEDPWSYDLDGGPTITTVSVHQDVADQLAPAVQRLINSRHTSHECQPLKLSPCRVKELEARTNG